MLNSIRQRLNIPPREEWRDRINEMIDTRVRAIMAGLSLKELRAIARGDPPTERPNPRYKVHTSSFWAHIRPRYYLEGMTWFTHTFRLGWFTMFFFALEVITGLILMVYYIPHPDQAYQSILEIESNVFFGKLFRDAHRLGAEAMLIFTVLHMLRTYFTGSYKAGRSFTWLTGVILLGITAWLSFSGYLLPWDQLAYWAVTVGTSITESGPVVGPAVNILMRGGVDIAANGLLRFYLQHVVLFPLLAIVFISVHYYKVSREHGISLPAKVEENALPEEEIKEANRRIDLIPDLLSHELFLVALGIFIVIFLVGFNFYGAPLETHANPQATPLDTKAPWYFWWLQGMLKIDPATILENLLARIGVNVQLGEILNSKFIMGLIIPPILVFILVAIPYIDRNPNRMARKRPFAIVWGVAWVFVLIALSYMGLPQFGIETPAATRIIQDLAPEEGLGELRAIPFEELQQGIYTVGEIAAGDDLCGRDFSYYPKDDANLVVGCPHLNSVFFEYQERLLKAEEEGALPGMSAVMVVEDWQPDVKKVTLSIDWLEGQEEKNYEKHYFLHQDRPRSE